MNYELLPEAYFVEIDRKGNNEYSKFIIRNKKILIPIENNQFWTQPKVMIENEIKLLNGDHQREYEEIVKSQSLASGTFGMVKENIDEIIWQHAQNCDNDNHLNCKYCVKFLSSDLDNMSKDDFIDAWDDMKHLYSDNGYVKHQFHSGDPPFTNNCKFLSQLFFIKDEWNDQVYVDIGSNSMNIKDTISNETCNIIDDRTKERCKYEREQALMHFLNMDPSNKNVCLKPKPNDEGFVQQSFIQSECKFADTSIPTQLPTLPSVATCPKITFEDPYKVMFYLLIFVVIIFT